jgi:glutamyl-tRNA(Gln) amidotransferase subunit E
MNPKPNDAFIVVVGPQRQAMHAMKKIVERAKMALDGVPQETRRLLPNGNSEFLRVIHGKERIYPDTDTPPIDISKKTVEECRKKVGKRPWEIYNQLNTKYNLKQSQVDLLIRAEKIEKLYDYTEKLGLTGQLAYRLLIEVPRRKRRQGIRLSNRSIDKLAEGLSRKIIIPEQIDSLIDVFATQPNLNTEEAKGKLGISRVGKAELNKLIKQKLHFFDEVKIRSDRNYRKLATVKIVGEVLKIVNYSVSGRDVAEKIEDLIRENKRK